MRTTPLTPEEQASLRTRLRLFKQLSLRALDLEKELEAEGAPPDAFLHLAMMQARGRSAGMEYLLALRRERRIPWSTVAEVLRLYGISPESVVAWERRAVQQAARALGVPHWFREGVAKAAGGLLVLRHLAQVTSLPDNLLLSRLILVDLLGLEHLPEAAEVDAEVELDDLPVVSNWPDWLPNTKAKVVVRNCPRLGAQPLERPPERLSLHAQSLPEAPVAFGALKSLELVHMPTLVHLPGVLECDNLVIRQCAVLEAVPGRLRGRATETASPRGTFRIERCGRLAMLPEKADYAAHLEIDRCPNLRGLGQSLWLAGHLKLSLLPRLERLPECLWVPGHLHLEDLAALSDLGAGLAVGGNLVVRNVPGLARLPEQLRVGGDLTLVDLDHLPDVPPSLEVKGRIRVHPRFMKAGWPLHLRRKLTSEPLEPFRAGTFG